MHPQIRKIAARNSDPRNIHCNACTSREVNRHSLNECYSVVHRTMFI